MGVAVSATREQNERLGELVRELFERRHRVDLHNLFDRGAMAIVGQDRTEGDGDTLDDAVELAARKAGIMGRAKSIPSRAEMPTLTDYSAIRGKR